MKKQPTTKEVSKKPVELTKILEETPKMESGKTLGKEIPGARWFVVHTYSGHENKVMATLKQRIDTMKLDNKIFDIVVPTRNIVQVQHGKKHEVKEKIFPGYILVRMILDDESWLAIRTTQGVTAFVGTGNKPTPISDKEVETIIRFMGQEAPKFKAKFTVSEAVKIVDGPFADFLGTIDNIDEEKGKLKVLVSIFGRETPVELDFLQVAKL
jgi:transcription termination/antitermination protein NusG